MAVSKLIFRVDDQAHKIISCESFVSVGEKFDVIIEGGKTENWQGKTVHLTFSQTASMADDVLEVISGIASEMSGSIQITTDAMLKNKRTLNYVSKWGNRGASVRVGLKTDDTDYGATKTKVFSNRANDGTPLPEFQKDVDKHNKDPEAHADIRQAITDGDAGVERRTKEYSQTLVSQERNDRNAEIQRAINEQGISSLPDLANGAAASAKAAADGALAASRMADAAADSLIGSKKVESSVSSIHDSVVDAGKDIDVKYESIDRLSKLAVESATNAFISSGNAKSSEISASSSAASASKSALEATSERGSAIRIANEAKAIAEGSTKAFVFDSEMDMQRFVAKQVALPESQRVVKVGSNLLIKQKGIPDYWWTGVNPWIEELESKGEQKIVVDDVPTMGSNNPVSSNGTYVELKELEHLLSSKMSATEVIDALKKKADMVDTGGGTIVIGKDGGQVLRLKASGTSYPNRGDANIEWDTGKDDYGQPYPRRGILNVGKVYTDYAGTEHFTIGGSLSDIEPYIDITRKRGSILPSIRFYDGAGHFSQFAFYEQIPDMSKYSRFHFEENDNGECFLSIGSGTFNDSWFKGIYAWTTPDGRTLMRIVLPDGRSNTFADESDLSKKQDILTQESNAGTGIFIKDGIISAQVPEIAVDIAGVERLQKAVIKAVDPVLFDDAEIKRVYQEIEELVGSVPPDPDPMPASASVPEATATAQEAGLDHMNLVRTLEHGEGVGGEAMTEQLEGIVGNGN